MYEIYNEHDEYDDNLPLRAKALRREIVGLARKIAHRRCDGDYPQVHGGLNKAVGVEVLSDCDIERLERQLKLATRWLEEGTEPN